MAGNIGAHIIDGTPGTVWVNDTGRARYQFSCSLSNTCASCLQFHMKIGPPWPIPLHWGCRCRQALVAPGAQAPEPFADYRKILADMPHDQQVAAMGASNYKLLESGKATWEDIVTPSRVRDFREVVAIKRLSVKQLTDAGVKPRWAEQAHAAVHTAEHEAVEAHRRELIQRITGAGLAREDLVKQLSGRLAERVSIAEGPEVILKAGPTGRIAWGGGRLILPGPGHAAELTTLLAAMTPKPVHLPFEPIATPELPIRHPNTPTPGEAEKVEEPEPIHLPFEPIATPELPIRSPKEPRPPEAPPPPPAPTPAKPKPPPKPKAPPKPKEPPFPGASTDVEVVKRLGGSTGAELVKDPKTGRLYVRKKGGNAGHLREENTADALYRTMGLDVPKSKLYEAAGGPVKLSEFHEGKTLGELKQFNTPAYEAATATLRKGFVADCLLGNWDVIGMGADNILVTPDGKVLRIDNGGSLRYRAQGAIKGPSQFGPTVTELHTMRDGTVNSAAARVFAGVTDKEIKAQIAAITRKQAAIIKAAPDELKDILRQRIENLKAFGKAPKIAGWKPTPAANFKTFTSAHEGDEWARNASYKDWADNLTATQRQAIAAYKKGSSDSLNAYHRNPGSGTHGTTLDRIKLLTQELDSALAQHPLPAAVTTVRYFSLSSAGLSYDQVKLGSDIFDTGYVSTSVNPGHQWSGHRFEVRVPKGTPAGYVRIASHTHQNEYELLLGRSADTFRVVELKNDADQTIVLELVESKPKPPKGTP